MVDRLRVNGQISTSARRRRLETNHRIASAYLLHSKGNSNRVIAERLGVSEESVCHYLRIAGVPSRGGGRYPAGFRQEVAA